jgi:hypothetical protein
MLEFFAPEYAFLFSPEALDRPGNLMLLAHDYHKRFDQMQFYFEPVDGCEHTYMLAAEKPRYRMKLPTHLVTFRKHSTIERPLPELLCVKAALSKVLHASGAAEFITQSFRDIGEACVACDGSTDLEALLTMAIVARPGLVLVR